MKSCVVSLCCVLFALGSSAAAAAPADKAKAKADVSADYRVGDRLAPGVGASAPDTDVFKATEWDALVPKDWDPMKGIDRLSLAMLRDSDPRAKEALDKLKQAWDAAPVAPAMNNARIRIAGFVVPLDAEGEAIHEFLLVPYFGACIHTPPPPANQVIHVTLATPAKGVRMMDAIWVTGVMHTTSSDTGMGTAGYRMDGQSVRPYQGKR